MITQVYSHPFESFSSDILSVIYSYVDAEDRKKISLIDKKTYKMSLALILSIRLFSHYSGSNKDAPENTLVNIIKRYPNAQKLTLGPKFSSPSTSCEGFGEAEEKHLLAMSAFLKAYPNQPFRKIELHEITDKWSKMPAQKAELHLSLIQAFKLSKLNSIVIRVLSNESVLSGKEIQPILSEDVTLKKFKLIRDAHSEVRSAFSETMAMSISFKYQSSLISAKFHHLHLPFKTIISLEACTDLETLVLDQCYFENSEIKTFLINKPFKRLKRLEILNIAILSDHELDEITKQLPRLETLHISLKNVTEEGFKKLSQNCPKLRTLKLSYPAAKDKELEYLANNFPDLEMLSFEGLSITEKGIEFLANCSKLRILKIGNLKNLETLCIKTLPKALPNLEVLEISHSEIIIVKELPYLVENMPKLVYLQIRSDQNIKTQEYLSQLKEKFSHLLEIPLTRKIQEFLS